MTSHNADPSWPTVRTRILILSDTHTQPPKPASNTHHAYRDPLPDAEILLHAGDLTKTGRLVEYRPMAEMVKRHPAELKLVIAGNHDITLDEQYYKSPYGRQKHEDEDLVAVRELWSGEDAKNNGLVYLEEGTQTFGLRNGARFTVYSSPYQPEFCNWAFAYARNQDRFNPTTLISRLRHPSQASCVQPVPDYPKVDIMLTHGPPKGILDETIRDEVVGCDHLLKAVKRCRPLLHCFGHIHEGWGATRMDWTTSQSEYIDVDPGKLLEERCAHMNLSESATETKPLRRGQETMFINASIMNVRYKPTNAPWLVDLDLPIRKVET